MTTVTREVTIGAPVDAVWALLEAVRRLPEFSSGTESVTDAPARLTHVGQTFGQVGRILGKRYTSQWTVTAIEPCRRLATRGSIGLGVSYSLEETLVPLGDDRCRLSLSLTYTPPGGVLGRLAAKAGVEQTATHQVEEVLRGLQRVAESSRTAGASRS